MHTGNAKTNPLCHSGALNEYISYIGFIWIFCYLPVRALNLFSLSWISALPISPHLVWIVSPHQTHRRGNGIHLVITNTVFADIPSAPVPNIHSFQLKEIWQVRWVKHNFFPLRRKSNASVYKTLCVLIIINRNVLISLFRPLSGFEVSLTNGLL